jgi:hypothetical protein
MYTLHSCAKMHKLLIFLDTKCINNELVISTQSLTPAMKKLLYSYLVFCIQTAYDNAQRNDSKNHPIREAYI